MRPGLRAGRPAVKGISTEILWEHEQAGETISEIADEYGLYRGGRALGDRLRDLGTTPHDRAGRDRPASTTTSMLTCSALAKILVQLRGRT